MTMPEQININELKRLLIEIVDDILDNVELVGMTFSPSRERLKERINRQIENAILDGDDS